MGLAIAAPSSGGPYNRPYYHRQKCRSMTLVFGNIIICRCSNPFLGELSSKRSAVVEIDEFAVLPMLYLRKF